MGAGLLPRRFTGRAEIMMLAAYGVVTAYAFGLLLNLSSWPFVLGIAVPGHAGLAFVPGDPMVVNLHRFLIYTLITSTGSFDTGRAITNAIAIVVLGPAVLTTLRRAARRVVIVGAVEKPLSPSTATPSVSATDERKEAAMTTPPTGLRDEAGSQI
jgi:energy-coupling factor transport system substrate-specific component